MEDEETTDPLAEMRAKYGHYFDGIDPVAFVAELRGDDDQAMIARLTEERDELRAALVPFARYAVAADRPERGNGGRDTDIIDRINDVAITLGDLRRAARLAGEELGDVGTNLD